MFFLIPKKTVNLHTKHDYWRLSDAVFCGFLGVASISGALAGAIARERQERQVPGADSVSCSPKPLGQLIAVDSVDLLPNQWWKWRNKGNIIVWYLVVYWWVSRPTCWEAQGWAPGNPWHGDSNNQPDFSKALDSGNLNGRCPDGVPCTVVIRCLGFW